MSKQYYKDTDYRIGFTAQTLAPLRRMEIPVPDQAVYSPASIYYVRGDKTRVGDGASSCSWIYDAIALDTLYKLLAFLQGADYKRLYIRTDTRDASSPTPRGMFNVYYCIMYKPILSGQEGVNIARSPYALQSVKLSFVDLVLQPGYL